MLESYASCSKILSCPSLSDNVFPTAWWLVGGGCNGVGVANDVGIEDKGGLCESVEDMVVVVWFSDEEAIFKWILIIIFYVLCCILLVMHNIGTVFLAVKTIIQFSQNANHSQILTAVLAVLLVLSQYCVCK